MKHSVILFVASIAGLFLFNYAVLANLPLLTYTFGFAYALFVPGLLLMSVIRISTEGIWERLVYSAGLGLSFLLFLGLGINTVLPLFEIVDPLSQTNLLMGFDIVVGFLTLLILIKRLTFSFHTQGRITPWDLLFLIFSSLFPVLMAFGAFRINNGYSNELSLSVLGLIAILIVSTLCIRKQLNDFVYPYIIFMIGLSILLMLSMRGTLVSGSDIMTEYKMFMITFNKSWWDINSVNHAYYSCLSITILPTVFAKLLNIDPLYVYKLLFQIITALLPVTVYLLSKKFFSSKLSFLSAIFFISFPIFVDALAMHMRQEIAFFFFALVVYSFFSKKIHVGSHKILTYVFALSMIVSHYSTSYVAILLFGFTFAATYPIQILYKFFKIPKSKSYISLLFVIFLTTTTIFWYSDLNNKSSNILGYVYNTVMSLNNLFKNDIRKEQTGLSDQFNISFKAKDRNVLFSEYMNEVKSRPRLPGLYDPASYASYNPYLVNTDTIPAKIPEDLVSIIYKASEIVKKVFKGLILIGVVIMFLKLKSSKISGDLLAICSSGMVVLLIFIVVPSFTVDYDLLRTFQQLMVFLTIPFLFIFTLTKNTFVYRLLLILSIVLSLWYFLTYSHFISEVIGNTYPVLQLNNFGDGYNIYYLRQSEAKSAQWFEKEKQSGGITVYADWYSYSKNLASTMGFLYPRREIMPATMYRQSYTYLTYHNEVKKIVYSDVNAAGFVYLYPYNFMMENKNQIYSNKESSIFR